MLLKSLWGSKPLWFMLFVHPTPWCNWASGLEVGRWLWFYVFHWTSPSLIYAKKKRQQVTTRINLLCVQLQRRFNLTPRKCPQWGHKGYCFYRIEGSMFVNISVCHSRAKSFRFENRSPDAITSSLSNEIPDLNVNRSQMYFMKQIISNGHLLSSITLSYYFSHLLHVPTELARHCIHALELIYCILCIPNSFSKHNTHTNSSVRSCQQLLALPVFPMACFECCPMKILI